MIVINQLLLDGLKTHRGLLEGIQVAIRLEHATIPPYLTALYSIKPGYNQEVARTIQSVVCEEMLHLSLMCNLYNAISPNPPVIDSPTFIMNYPAVLPGSVQGALKVGLWALSLPLLEQVFMVIEQPVNPVPLEGAPYAPHAPAPGTVTVDEFYREILRQIEHPSSGLAQTFNGDASRQLDGKLLNWRFGQGIFPVLDVASARRAIEVIVSQGEGSEGSPVDVDGSYSHYYRFGEVVNGRKLEHRGSNPRKGWGYTGAPIAFDPNGVYPMRPNPKSADLCPGSTLRLMSDEFNFTYTSLLKLLQRTFGGEPGLFLQAFGLMSSLRSQAGRLMQCALPPGGHTAGPSFEYLSLLG